MQPSHLGALPHKRLTVESANKFPRENNMATTPTVDEPVNGAPPASAWVRFLRSYGPTPNNLTMFDEYVSGAVVRARVQPINLSTPLLEKMIQHIESKTPGSVLIAGTAGDGKTYHCRAL